MFATFRSSISLVLTLNLLCLVASGTRAAADDLSREGRRYALIIGVNTYDNGLVIKGDVKTLFAESDAARFAQTLRSRGFSPDSIVTMTTALPRDNPRYPTAANVREQIKAIAGRLTSRDSVVVAFAGNERQFAGDDDYYMCPSDAEFDDARTLISLREVCSALEQADGNGKLVIVDSCRVREGPGKAPTPRLPGRSVGVLFACSAGQEAAEEAPTGGVLSYFVVEGLSGAADDDKDGTITTAELVSYVKARVPLYRKNQTPELIGPVPPIEFIIRVKELTAKEGPSLYVLSIGINDYPDKRLKLDCAAPDARDIRQAFLTHSRRQFPGGVEARLLLDGQATRANILEGLQWLAGKAKGNDVAVVFYAGHGDSQIEGQFYLVPVDANLRKLGASGVSGVSLRKALGDLPCTTMLILDACDSGGFDAKATKTRKTRGLPTATDTMLRQMVNDEGLVVMCGAAKGKEAAEENGHGFFTRAIIDGLSGKADVFKKGRVDLIDLQAYVINRVGELSADEQQPTISIPSTIRSFPLSKP
ncbi:MAG: caspase family protein [Isosphaeraceae bacterium]|jgi:uncharacterized caspase-like protein